MAFSDDLWTTACTNKAGPAPTSLALHQQVWPCTNKFGPAPTSLALHQQGWPCTSKVGPAPARLALAPLPLLYQNNSVFFFLKQIIDQGYLHHALVFSHH
jgi:hypothetical protein